MQVLKEDIRDRIVAIAREEFLNNGFQRTSMKRIAEGAGITAPTIYCYFKNKEALFLHLVKPVTDYFIERENRVRNANPMELVRTWGMEQRKTEYSEHMKFIGNHRDEFRLLFACAGGSSLENYFDRLVGQYEILMKKIMEILEGSGILNRSVSDFFIHNMAAFYVNTLREASLHNVSDKELEQFAEEWALFRTEGWKKLTATGEKSKGRKYR